MSGSRSVEILHLETDVALNTATFYYFEHNRKIRVLLVEQIETVPHSSSNLVRRKDKTDVAYTLGL